MSDNDDQILISFFEPLVSFIDDNRRRRIEILIISLIKPRYNSINKRLGINCNDVEVLTSSLNYILDFHLLNASIIPLDTPSFIVLFL